MTSCDDDDNNVEESVSRRLEVDISTFSQPILIQPKRHIGKVEVRPRYTGLIQTHLT
jgi:hypothetical protein